MKILITSDWYTPAINGVTTSVLNLRKGLMELGHDVRVATLSQTRHSYEEDGVYYLASISANKIYPGARFKTAPPNRYIKDILDWKPDIVHSNCELCTYGLAKSICHKLDIPLVHTYHTVYENYTHYFSPSKRVGKKVVEVATRFVSRQTDCLIAPSGKVKKLLEGYHVKCDVYVVPSGLDESRFKLRPTDEWRAEVRRSLNIPDGNTILISVGRLAKEKNHTELIHFMENFRGEPITLLIVGGGPYFENLKTLTEELKLTDQVLFTGMIQPEKIADYYTVGDIFVNASTSETQGLTYMEALMSGLPMLCRKDDCLEGVIIEGEDGWQYENEAEYLEKVRYFVEHKDEWSRLKNSAEEQGHNFSIPGFAGHMVKIYEERLAMK